MEPLFFKAENELQRALERAAQAASMEPLFFKAENNLKEVDVFGFITASMEPLFFKAENLPGLVRRRAAEALQWSRFFSKRKIRTIVRTRIFSPF